MAPWVVGQVVGLDGVEPSTPALSRRCSNQLSYRPAGGVRMAVSSKQQPIDGERYESAFSRKEVIQPHLPIRLPCYDFTPVMNLTVVGAIPCGLSDRLLVKPTPMV